MGSDACQIIIKNLMIQDILDKMFWRLNISLRFKLVNMNL